MPVKARRSKSRRTRLTLAEALSLTIGDAPDATASMGWRSCFASPEDRRAAWEWHREELIGRVPGRRPQAWWEYDSPEPLDWNDHQSRQLWRMGVLKGAELAQVMAVWADWARQAQHLHFPRAPLPTIPPGPEAAAAWRDWAGIPDELFRSPGHALDPAALEPEVLALGSDDPP